MSTRPFFWTQNTERPAVHKATQRTRATLLTDAAAWERYGWIVESVAARHRVRVTDILSAWRYPPVAMARQDLYACLHGSGLSYPAVGRLVGRDHSTVLVGVRKELG